MVQWNAEIEVFGNFGEKSGWRYVSIPRAMAEKIKPDCRKSFRVRGFLDDYSIAGLATTPMGDGDFILALKASLRRAIGKEEGQMLNLQLEEDVDYKVEIPEDLESCLADEPVLLERFISLSKFHQSYFIKHVMDAKTVETRSRRIGMIIDAMDKNWDFGQMIRGNRKK